MTNEQAAKIVDPATVGQYTGLNDKNSVRIFEGDILKRTYELFCSKTKKKIVVQTGYAVEYSNGGFRAHNAEAALERSRA